MGRFRTRTVLVVEDERDLRDIIRDLIDDAGFESVGVRHGAEAQEWLLKNPPPAVVLLDLMMPNMNGWQFLKWLATQPDLASVPVVALSGAPEDGVELAQTIRALQGCLRKPFEPQALLDTVSGLAA